MGADTSAQFQKVSKHYGSVCALECLDMTVNSGEFVTLLGASGSGKTTALNILAGFFPQSSGSVLVGGRDISRLPPEKRGLGVVFQNYSLFPMMTVAENVGYPLRMRGVAKAEIARRVGEALEIVRMGAFAKRMPKELSGGQQQRVAFARAIVYNPGVLLMDEPLGALDQKLREELQFEIRDYHRQLGCTIIFVTHDQREALLLSDRIAVMHRGRLEQMGTPKEIYDRPSSRYIAEFVGKSNFFDIAEENGRAVAPALGLDLGEFTPATVAVVRPERFRLSAPSEGLAARVEKVTFLGDCLSVDAIAAGKPISLQFPRSDEAAIMVGQTIGLKVDRNDVAVTAAAR